MLKEQVSQNQQEELQKQPSLLKTYEVVQYLTSPENESKHFQAVESMMEYVRHTTGNFNEFFRNVSGYVFQSFAIDYLKQEHPDATILDSVETLDWIGADEQEVLDVKLQADYANWEQLYSNQRSNKQALRAQRQHIDEEYAGLTTKDVHKLTRSVKARPHRYRKSFDKHVLENSSHYNVHYTLRDPIVFSTVRNRYTPDGLMFKDNQVTMIECACHNPANKDNDDIYYFNKLSRFYQERNQVQSLKDASLLLVIPYGNYLPDAIKQAAVQDEAFVQYEHVPIKYRTICSTVNQYLQEYRYANDPDSPTFIERWAQK